jgi:hypothetical protein
MLISMTYSQKATPFIYNLSTSHSDDPLSPHDVLLGTWADLVPLITEIHRLEGPQAYSMTESDYHYRLSLIESRLNNEMNYFGQSHAESHRADATKIDSFERHDVAGQLQLDLVSMKEAYRASALLRLHQLCPMLLSHRFSTNIDPSDIDIKTLLRHEAMEVLGLLQSISIESRLFNVASFPLMTAGQYCDLGHDQDWVRSVFSYLRLKNGIAAIAVLSQSLEKVWQRRAMGEDVLWTTIFKEEGFDMLIN